MRLPSQAAFFFIILSRAAGCKLPLPAAQNHQARERWPLEPALASEAKQF